MDKNSGKRGVTGSTTPRKAVKVGVKDTTTSKDQFCNRIGCQGRIKYTNQNAKTGSSDKAKCSKPSFSSPSNGNEIIKNGNSSVMTKPKSPNLDSKRKLPPQSESDTSESSQSGDSSTHTNTSRESKPGPSRSNKNNTQAASSISKSSGLGTPNSSNKNKCLKNLKCSNSVPDVVQSKPAAKNATKKRSPEAAESSPSRRGKNPTATSSSNSGSVSSSRRSSWTNGEESSSASSVRTRRSNYANQNRTAGQNGRNASLGREASRTPTRAGDSNQLQQSGNGSSNAWSFLSIRHDENQSPFGSSDLGFRRYNMDGMSEVLMELERIEQDEEMTHEQILAFEASLYLSNRSMFDQHRDMRLDIDNMSYEELLALGERMGTVSTALSEDTLSNCMKKSVYQVIPSEERFMGSGEDGDDVNCSICQEEYQTGDDVGKLLECHHVYHTLCINQWLRLKNWCPICKTAAAPQEESS